MTAQGDVRRIDTTTGRIAGRPTHVPTGLCAWESVVGRYLWATSVPFGDFACTNGTSRVDTRSGRVTALPSAEGKSLYTLARYAGSLWATDRHNTVYEVDEDSGALRPAMTLDHKDANHLFTAFGALWMTRSGTGELLRLRTS